MKKKLIRETITEGYGAGFSFTGGFTGGFRGGLGGTTRGGFGGANNLGGPNMMYTYEIKPLNHTLEQRPNTDSETRAESIQLGSKISGYPIRSNITPNEKKRIRGIVWKIEKTEGDAIKYYVVIDEATQKPVKIDPLTAALVIHEPVEYFFNATDKIPSKRKRQIRDARDDSKKIVRESLEDIL
jgi:hypothetical protein